MFGPCNTYDKVKHEIRFSCDVRLKMITLKCILHHCVEIFHVGNK